MHQMASWKNSLGSVVFGILLFTSSAQAQQGGTTASPSGDARSYTQFGMENGAKGDLNGAMAAFNQALQIDPKYAPAYYGRGHVRSVQKDFVGALSDFNRAIEIDPTYRAAFYERGSMEGR